MTGPFLMGKQELHMSRRTQRRSPDGIVHKNNSLSLLLTLLAKAVAQEIKKQPPSLANARRSRSPRQQKK